MSVLLLRLAAPLQAWGNESFFRARHTHLSPSKSGVIGMLASAQGRHRDADISDIAALRFGTRTDQPGRVLRDYHTARVPGAKNTNLSERYYLSDAVFVAGVEGERSALEILAGALQKPAFPLYLGRRSCPPSAPIVIGMVDAPLEQALAECPWQAAPWFQRAKRREGYTAVLAVEPEDTEGAHLVQDQPVSFSKVHRRFASRSQRRDLLVMLEAEPPHHDPFAALEGDDNVPGQA